MMTLVKPIIVPVSLLVSWCCLLLACIALPVTVSFTITSSSTSSSTSSTFLLPSTSSAMEKGHSATSTATTITRGRHCHIHYNSLRRRQHHEQFTCAMLKMNKIATMEDVLDTTTTTTTAAANSTCADSSEGHEAASLLEQVDAILHTKMEHGATSLSLSQRKEETLAMIDASHANDVDFCASLGTEESIAMSMSMSTSDSVSVSGIIQNPASAPIIPAYEWVYGNGNGNGNDNDNDNDNDSKDNSDSTRRRPIAIRTIDPQQPILDQDSISIIRNAAQNMWEANRAKADADADAQSSSSRFTYQRKGNYEAHLVDLANDIDDNGRIRTIMMDALGQRIYPMVRDAFRPLVSELDDLDLRVYDSLVIRYNSTEAMMMGNPFDADHDHDHDHDDVTGANGAARSFLGAGQPLHRDLGLISVNIMLNPAEEFQGGGTFLENQLRDHIGIPVGDDGDGDGDCHKHDDRDGDPLPVPLKPIGAGHAVAHLSNERHAGVATTGGVRDILVLFLTATKKSSIPHNNNDVDLNLNDVPVESTHIHTHTAPRMERAARLKTYARPNCINCETLDESILCRMMHHRLALQFSPQDGEAWHYLGMSLREYAKMKTSTNTNTNTNAKHEPPLVALEMMQLSIACLERAFQLTPCDGRLCNNLGLAYETLSTYIAIGTGSNDSISGKEEEAHANNAIDHYYTQSVRIHELCERVGCDISFDFATVTLNYGLFVSNNDEFYDAVQILKKLRRIGKGVKYVENPEEDRIIEDGLRLLNFCEAMNK